MKYKALPCDSRVLEIGHFFCDGEALWLHSPQGAPPFKPQLGVQTKRCERLSKRDGTTSVPHSCGRSSFSPISSAAFLLNSSSIGDVLRALSVCHDTPTIIQKSATRPGMERNGTPNKDNKCLSPLYGPQYHLMSKQLRRSSPDHRNRDECPGHWVSQFTLERYIKPVRTDPNLGASPRPLKRAFASSLPP